MVKIHFLQKVLKKWSSFRKKRNFFFDNQEGGGVRGQDTIWNFPKFFFLNPSLNSPSVSNTIIQPIWLGEDCFSVSKTHYLLFIESKIDILLQQMALSIGQYHN